MISKKNINIGGINTNNNLTLDFDELLSKDLNNGKVLLNKIKNKELNSLLDAENYISDIYKRYDIPKTFYQIFNGILDTLTPNNINSTIINLSHCIKIIDSVINSKENYCLKGDKIKIKEKLYI